MPALTRWDPFRELSTIQDRMNRLFQNTVHFGPEEAFTTSAFMPLSDIYEDDNYITVRMEVPGIEEKDIDIRIENNTLTVRGERKIENEEKEENFHRMERQYGSFVRSFVLPSSVDSDKVEANYDKGVLTVQLAKRVEAKPKQIHIGVGKKQIEAKKAA